MGCAGTRRAGAAAHAPPAVSAQCGFPAKCLACPFLPDLHFQETESCWLSQACGLVCLGGVGDRCEFMCACECVCTYAHTHEQRGVPAFLMAQHEFYAKSLAKEGGPRIGPLVTERTATALPALGSMHCHLCSFIRAPGRETEGERQAEEAFLFFYKSSIYIGEGQPSCYYEP